MTWVSIVLKILKTLVELLKVAEQMFDDTPDSGEQKKAFVMDALKAVVEGMSGVTLTPELWAKIERACGYLIDAFCIFLFGSKSKTL